jgi:LysR family glycine cleavage system transcriptional activator
MDARRVPRLSLDLLRGFCAAARHLSFTRAAQELFVTQSAISREVRTLEEQLGAPLFRRTGRALELTDAGRDLARAVDEALALIDAASGRIVQPARHLSVTVPVPIASMWLGPRLSRFTRRHPDIELRIAADNDTVDLERDGFDLAIRHVLRGSAAPKVPDAQFLFEHRTFPVIAPALLRERPLRTAADLARHVLLRFETTRNGRPWLDWPWWFEAMGLRDLPGAGTLRFSHYDQLVQAAIEGSGVAIGRLPHLIQHLRDGSLVAPLGDPGSVTIGSFFVVASSRAPRDLVDAFAEWLHDEARDSAAP